MTTRKALRDSVRTALEEDARFADTDFRAWGRNTDDTQPRVIGIFTPRVNVSGAAVLMRRQTVDLVVACRRFGSDALEDDLDDDADRIDDLAVPVLNALCDDAALVSIENDVPSVAETRVGTVYLTFRCELLTDRPV